MSDAISPFDPTGSSAVSEPAIKDLQERLRRTRWPDTETVTDGSQGVPLHWHKSLCADWLQHDLRPALKAMKDFGSFQTDIDGLTIHFLHRKGPAGSRPLILTHGWPGGLVEFLDVLTPLSAHFDLIVPSLPGYGFSTVPSETGWGLERIADAWATLMTRLGYTHYTAQGGDWGAEISALLAQRHPEACKGAHINLVSARPPASVLSEPTPAERAALMRQKHWARMEMAYFRQQASRPQTLGYGLADSPSGQAAWIAEKFRAWTDSDPGRPIGGVSRARLLDLISIYWFTNTATSSARLYWESGYSSGRTEITAPVACTLYPAEIMKPSRRWAENRYKKIVRWVEMNRGGHFAAMEVPDLFVPDVIETAKQFWE